MEKSLTKLKPSHDSQQWQSDYEDEIEYDGYPSIENRLTYLSFKKPKTCVLINVNVWKDKTGKLY